MPHVDRRAPETRKRRLSGREPTSGEPAEDRMPRVIGLWTLITRAAAALTLYSGPVPAARQPGRARRGPWRADADGACLLRRARRGGFAHQGRRRPLDPRPRANESGKVKGDANASLPVPRLGTNGTGSPAPPRCLFHQRWTNRRHWHPPHVQMAPRGTLAGPRRAEASSSEGRRLDHLDAERRAASRLSRTRLHLTFR